MSDIVKRLADYAEGRAQGQEDREGECQYLRAENQRLRAVLSAIVEIGTYGTAYQAHNLARRGLGEK